MEIINGKKIKESLAKGFMLLTLTGALTAKNPVATNNGNTVVYAAETLESKQTKALKNLEKVYKYYSKSYYTEKEYKKLTSAYNKGVKAIKACKDKTSIQNTYEEYKEKLNAIKPSILVKYQKKMEKSLLKSYKSLVSKNEYSDYNLSKLEEFKEEGIEKIYASKNKSKAKKNKTAYVKKMKSVTTSLDQTRAYMVNYINNNKDLTENEKKAIIEEINNAKNVDAIVAIGEEYGYEEVVNETITVDQINAKIKELCKKYPKYTEDEIRVLVASANMDFVNQDDIYTIFNVSSKEELAKKGEILDELLFEITDQLGYQHYTIQNPEITFDEYDRKYDEEMKINDIFINKTLKQNAEYANNLATIMVEEPYETTNYANPEKIVAGDRAAIESLDYLFDRIETKTRNFEFMKGYATTISDPLLTDTMAGYIIKSFMISTYAQVANYDLDSLIPQKDNNNISRAALFELKPDNKLKSYSKVKQ